MNERVEAYLEKYHCLYYVAEVYGDAVEDPHYFMYQEDVEGLIQLVVRECVEVMKQHSFHQRTQNAVLEHFGVK